MSMHLGLPMAASLLHAIRPHHWLKNALVFVPAIAAHRILQPDVAVEVGLAFAAFSFAASSGYLLNDLRDYQHDRRHPSKRHRPVASGKVPRPVTIGSSVALFASALVLSILFLPLSFVWVLLAYSVVSVMYTYLLKEVKLIDVLVLTLLYVLRIVGGGEATDIVLSDWLITFAMFLFFSLSLVKRVSDIEGLSESDDLGGSRTKYNLQERDLMAMMGLASGYLSVLVLALYIANIPTTGVTYARPVGLWLMCPCLLFWISHIWMKAFGDEIPGDPVLFTVRDVPSLVTLLGMILLFIYAI